MIICVKSAGILRRYVKEQEMNIPEGMCIRNLLENFSVPSELKLMVFVDAKRRDLDQILEDGNEVLLITLLTGG
jgi:hypothetical protein